MFESARLRLTTWYLFVIMVISSMFSIVIYEVLASQIEDLARTQRITIENNLQHTGCVYIDRNASRLIPQLPVSSELIDVAKQKIAQTLIVVNSGIFVIAAVSGYLLAGKTLAPIKAMVTEQNRFISDASHELRTPLTALKLGLEVFLRNNKPSIAEATEVARESLTEVERLQGFADSVLMLSTLDHHNIAATFSPVPVQDIITAAVKQVRPLARQKQIRLTAPKNIQAVVRGQLTSLIQLCVLILDNAIKYSPKKSSVSVSVTTAKNTVEIAITDQGIGIEPTDLPRIFDRLYRSDKARTTTHHGGYGLGLSIAKQLATLHGGDIRVQSTPNHGSTFTITIPIHTTH